MIDKYKNDKKYRNKVNLLGYGVFVVIVVIYSIISNNEIIANMYNYNQTGTANNGSLEEVGDKIVLPDKYNYKYVIKINDKVYNYSGTYDNDELTIVKSYDDEIVEYLYKNNDYYIKSGDGYLLTNISSVYDNVDYNYLDINNISTYMSKAVYDGNNYRVYVKDILLNSDSSDYFSINYYNSSDIKIEIDYTNFVKQLDSNINKYIVLMNYTRI